MDEVYEMGDLATTRVTTMGNIIETLSMERPATGSPCRKISKDQYVDLRTGEVFDYEHIENRAGSLQSIRHTLQRIRALVNTNVTQAENCRWVTLTYAENVTDTKRLHMDYKLFWQKFKRRYPGADYISVIEPQARGAWHVHAFFIWQEKAPFVPNAEIAELWGQGFSKTKALGNIDNIGAYFSAYLADIPLEDLEKMTPENVEKAVMTGKLVDKQLEDDYGHTVEKKFIKGGRLFMYPPGMNIVRKSKGIKDPIVERMTLKEAKEKTSAATETFSCSSELINDSGAVVNRFTRRYYNTKRK